MGRTRSYQFITGPETSTLPTAVGPVADSDLMTLGYAKAHYVQGLEAAADVAAVKALDVADRTDKDAVLVESKNAMYRYDSNSSDTADDDLIIQPTAGSGRWLKTNGIVNPVTGDGEIPNDLKVDTIIEKTVASGVLVDGVKCKDNNIELANQSETRFLEQTGNGTNYVGLKAPDAISSSIAFKLPGSDGSVGQVLKTDGSLGLDWASVSTSSLTHKAIRVGDSSNFVEELRTDILGQVSAETSSNVVTFDYTGNGDGEDVVLWTGHTLSLDDSLYFTNSGGSLPTGISAETKYYVVTVNTNSFQISTSYRGSVLEFTSDGSGTSTIYYGGLNLSSPIYSGTYTPTTSSVTGGTLSYLADPTYIKIMNVVTVSGTFGFDPTAAGSNCNFEMSLPIPSSFTDSSHAGGAGGSYNSKSWGARAKAANNTVEIYGQFGYDNGVEEVGYSFTYRIL